jgi:streptogramin lyase
VRVLRFRFVLRRLPALLAFTLTVASVGAACSRTRGGDFGMSGPDGSTALPEVECNPPCDDGVFCNGEEECDPRTASCLPGDPPDCDDGEECTVDRCDPGADECSHVEMPRDDDGDGFNACPDDCDDTDPDIHPGAREFCDAVDQDCDGRTDEGLRSECDDCRPGCKRVDIPGEVTGGWQLSPENSGSVEVDGSGALVLSSETSERFDAWIALSDDGKVTKVDTRDGRQLARYDSVLSGPSNRAQPPNAACDHTSESEPENGNCPSRTAVDLQGAVYVANRAFGHQGTVTKIAGFPADCVDRDGDGAIETSTDVNGSGRIDSQVAGEFLGQSDECLLWTVDVGGMDSVPRAVAVAADGTVWVGLHGESRVVQLDPKDGRELASVTVPGLRPYGAAIDGNGTLWLTAVATGQIVSVDTRTRTAGKAVTAPSVESGCPSSYGVAIDYKDRVWIAGLTCPHAFRYDPTAGSWMVVELPDSGVTRGITADDQGRVFVAASWAFLNFDPSPDEGLFVESSPPLTRLTRFRADDGGDLRVWGTALDPLPGGGAIGVGLDDQARAWLVNQDSGSATRVDTDTGEVKHYEVGNFPYTYSDFTGFALRRITAPTGFIREVIEGCPMGPTEWEHATVDASLPAGAQLQVRMRTAPSAEQLDVRAWFGPWEGTELDLVRAPGPLPTDRFLEVEARMVSGDRTSTPALREVVVQLHCPEWSWL